MHPKEWSSQVQWTSGFRFISIWDLLVVSVIQMTWRAVFSSSLRLEHACGTRTVQLILFLIDSMENARVVIALVPCLIFHLNAMEMWSISTILAVYNARLNWMFIDWITHANKWKNAILKHYGRMPRIWMIKSAVSVIAAVGWLVLLEVAMIAHNATLERVISIIIQGIAYRAVHWERKAIEFIHVSWLCIAFRRVWSASRVRLMGQFAWVVWVGLTYHGINACWEMSVQEALLRMIGIENALDVQ